jgi:hypothetical protein
MVFSVRSPVSCKRKDTSEGLGRWYAGPICSKIPLYRSDWAAYNCLKKFSLANNIVKRHLHPALKALGYTNPITGAAKAGTHAFRRFRNTFLKNHTACPSGLYKFWLGLAPTDMSDLYDKVKYDAGFRREWAEKSGIGFELFPLVVPNVPKNQPGQDIEKAA